MYNKLKISTYDHLRSFLIVKFNYDRKQLFTIVNDRFLGLKILYASHINSAGKKSRGHTN